MERYQGQKYNANFISVLISKATFSFKMIFETSLLFTIYLIKQ